MSNITDTLNAIKLTNNLYNTQVSSLLKTVQDDIDHLVLKTQTDLIAKVSQDYNISVRELTRKYISKPKKTRKTKGLDNDSPTLQTINDAANNLDLSDDETTITNIIVKNTSSPFLPSQDIAESKTDNANIENTSETVQLTKVLFKNV